MNLSATVSESRARVRTQTLMARQIISTPTGPLPIPRRPPKEALIVLCDLGRFLHASGINTRY